ncbi:GC-rich sequence DNA-binding factor-like protein-domain-containing protein [Hyaloraphidium curvatum]|nr:GC-rich sequence DNA-binding factor-like protein-domain-containing protein [Hyaloraphidium curvatum]
MHDPVEAMDAYSDLFARMERDMAEELAEFRLDELCIAAIVPWCQKLYSSWHPLEDPERGVAFFRRWRRLLMVDPALGQPSLGPQGPKRGAGAIRQMTPYESLLSLVWLPRVRQVISNEWDPRSPDELIAMLEVWYGSTSDKARLLPQWMFLNILDQLVTPKLERTLSHWNPRRDGQQVHTWIHPWLPVFGDARMQPLLDTVRQKMSVVLQDWKPSEDTALKMLEPWQEVFPTADMEALVTRIILPKLLLALRHELVVNPAKQDTKPIKWVLQWKDFLGPNVVAHALQTEFFPKWLWTLWQWLSHPSCNPAEVTQWYTVWKSPATSSGSAAGVFPADVLKHPAVAAGFRQGLDLMNRAMELRDAGVDLTKIPPPVPPPATSTSAPPPPPKFAKNAGSVTGGSRRSASPMPGEDPHGFAPAKATPKPAAPRFQASIHDVIEDFFASQDMTFLPVEGRVHEATGKPLWRVGRPGGRKGAGASVLAYLDDGVLYARNGDKWEPTAMEALAEKVMAM